jgi:hypothetical protein
MSVLNGSFAIMLTVLIVPLYGTGCAPLPKPPAPGERPAEIVLPPTNTVGNLNTVRRDVGQFRHGPKHLHQRAATCSGCVVEVEIQSVGRTTDIRPINGPARFRIVGRIKNNDPRDVEAKYSLKPDAEYLMWIAPARLNNARTSQTIWGLLELPPGSTGQIRPDTIGYVEVCPHTKPPATGTSDTDFRHCEGAHASQTPLHSQPALSAVTFFASSDASSSGLSYARPSWFDCGGVCCTGTDVTQ